ncbi:GPC5 protein, partial [Polyodon spathula]|nr:GPC5 protein [Polyodon spathula]
MQEIATWLHGCHDTPPKRAALIKVCSHPVYTNAWVGTVPKTALIIQGPSRPFSPHLPAPDAQLHSATSHSFADGHDLAWCPCWLHQKWIGEKERTLVTHLSRCWYGNGAGVAALSPLGANLNVHEEEARFPIGARDLEGLSPGVVGGAKRGGGVQLLQWMGAVVRLMWADTRESSKSCASFIAVSRVAGLWHHIHIWVSAPTHSRIAPLPWLHPFADPYSGRGLASCVQFRQNKSYTNRVVGNGLQAQKLNPEVKVRDLDPVLTQVKERLQRFNQVGQ